MFFQQYYLECLSHASYLIGDTTSGQAVVVDPQRDVSHYLADADIQDGEIIKTHDRAPDVIPDHWRVIYLYGDPDVIRRSVMTQSEDWKRVHFDHFGKVFVDDQMSLIDGDGLDLIGNAASWVGRDNVLHIHYDELFESTELISEFLGITITLPKRIKRSTT